ncbi:MAG: ANTAR domain-containing protein [Deltaproteobacteria bacterium]|uniref:ANTAR domain-containing protein n=1 Tax=Candidatus Zymogenus saltonus TaxID=2844893 RepID=A0A9D8KE38_9DELT|nr:ANTAR domain-containing protein [Candidatus Zymogenus saltonus]
MARAAEKGETSSNLELAKRIVMEKLDISEIDAIEKIKSLSRSKNLDTERTSEVIIKLENLISPSWFNGKSHR